MEHAHLTPEVEPVPFRARERLEDFAVAELPLVAPTGAGTHVWFELEKRGLSTRAALRRLARALGRREREFGYAGQKDARAVTRQWVSLEHVDPDRLRALALRDVAVGRIERSDRKLRVGALAGNRFELRLAGVDAAGLVRVERVLARVAELGLPNYYGPQRFGAGGRGHAAGADLVAGRFRAFVRRFADPDAPEPDASGPDAREPDARGPGEGRAAGAAGGVRAAARAELARRVAGLEPLEPVALRALGPRLDAERAALARHLARLAERAARGRRDPAEADGAEADGAEGGASEGEGDVDWRDAARAVPQRSRQMAISALQARVFNRVLAERIARAGPGGLARLEPGDVAYVHAGGASFLVGPEDLAPDARGPETAARLAAGELSPSGPVPGHRLLRAEGAPGAREAAALAAEGLALEDFRGLGMGLAQRGARRPLRVPLRAPAGTPLVRREGADAVRLAFELPPGAYATALLEELAKDRRPG